VLRRPPPAPELQNALHDRCLRRCLHHRRLWAYDQGVKLDVRARPPAKLSLRVSTLAPLDVRALITAKLNVRALASARRNVWVPTLALLAVACAATALGGCGSSSPTGTSASPATVVPSSAPLYVEADVTPTGNLQTYATATARTLTGRPKPFTTLLQLLQGPTGKTPNYDQEVKPWLGPHAGVFLDSIAASGAQGLVQEALTKALSEGLPGVEAALLGTSGLPALLESSAAQGALVLDTTDVAKAQSFLEAQAHSAGAHTASYGGITYEVAPDGVAEGIVHHFAVIGSEAGIKSVIATAAGGASLAQASTYTKLASTAETGALANAYLSFEALARSLKTTSASADSTLALLRGVLGNPAQAYLSLVPSSNTVALDVDTLPASTGSGTSESSSGESGSGGANHTGTTGAQVLSGLPGGAWLAVGIGDLGHTVGGNTQGLQAITSLLSGLNFGSISIAKAVAPLSSHSINVQHDLLSWMGPTGIYASGSSLLALQAAVVITSKDPALSRAAVPKLAQAYREVGAQTSPTSVPGAEVAMTIRLPDFPLELTMAYGQSKFVLGIGASSAQEALNPQTTLAGTPAYNTAASALGQGIQPSALVEFRTLLGLMESVGLNQAPGFSSIASAVQPLDTLAAGGGKSLPGGVKRARLVLGLQPAGG
jgi:hypothetical protein